MTPGLCTPHHRHGMRARSIKIIWQIIATINQLHGSISSENKHQPWISQCHARDAIRSTKGIAHSQKSKMELYKEADGDSDSGTWKVCLLTLWWNAVECITGVGSFPYRASHINQVYVGRGGVAHSSGYITPLHLLVQISQARGLTIIEKILKMWES